MCHHIVKISENDCVLKFKCEFIEKYGYFTLANWILRSSAVLRCAEPNVLNELWWQIWNSDVDTNLCHLIWIKITKNNSLLFYRRKVHQALVNAIIRRTLCAVVADVPPTTFKSQHAPNVDIPLLSCVHVSI